MPIITCITLVIAFGDHPAQPNPCKDRSGQLIARQAFRNTHTMPQQCQFHDLGLDHPTALPLAHFSAGNAIDSGSVLDELPTYAVLV